MLDFFPTIKKCEVNDRLECLNCSYLIFLRYGSQIDSQNSHFCCCATSSAKRNTEFFGTSPFHDSKIAPLPLPAWQWMRSNKDDAQSKTQTTEHQTLEARKVGSQASNQSFLTIKFRQFKTH